MTSTALDPGAGERLHPRIRILWIGGALLLSGLLVAAVLFVDRFARPLPELLAPAIALAVAIGAVGVALAFLRYRIWRFELQADALVLRRGVLTRVETAVPFVRIQHIDTQRGPIDRLAGLSSVVVYTAGTRGSDVTVPGLSPERAGRLRDRLRERAVESAPEDAV